jgi:hypothetical protein
MPATASNQNRRHENGEAGSVLLPALMEGHARGRDTLIERDRTKAGRLDHWPRESPLGTKYCLPASGTMSDQRLSARTPKPKPKMHRRHFARNFFATSDGPNVRARTEGKRRSTRPRVEPLDGGTVWPTKRAAALYGAAKCSPQAVRPPGTVGWGKQRNALWENGIRRTVKNPGRMGIEGGLRELPQRSRNRRCASASGERRPRLYLAPLRQAGGPAANPQAAAGANAPCAAGCAK